MGLLGLSKAKTTVLLWLATFALCCTAIVLYRAHLIEKGVQKCETKMEAVERDTQLRIDQAVDNALKAEKKLWLQWHEAEVQRALSQVETEVVYENTIKEIPVAVEASRCDNVGPDVLRVFNNAYGIKREPHQISY